MNLHILDCSNYIYAGNFNKVSMRNGVREVDGFYVESSAPIGGVRFLINEIIKLHDANNQVIPVFDRKPISKKKMFNELYGEDEVYKGGRGIKPPEIDLQKRLAEQILTLCSFPVNAVEEREADDVIAELVGVLKDDYDTIYIHTKDSDLFYLVSLNVEIAKVGAKGKAIDISNYHRTVSTKDTIYYNTILFRKLWKGDTADNIKGIGREWTRLINEEIPESDFDNLGDLDIARKYIRKAVINNSTRSGAHTILPTFNLLAPLRVPHESLNLEDYDPNMHLLLNYFALWVGCTTWLRSEDLIKSEEGDALINAYISDYYENSSH